MIPNSFVLREKPERSVKIIAQFSQNRFQILLSMSVLLESGLVSSKLRPTSR
jgi:hypothetical protein